MLHDLKHLIRAVETKAGKTIRLSSDFEKLAHLFAVRGLDVTAGALKNVWNHVGMKEKPSKALLDNLSLFAGFQSWNDFKLALHGGDVGDLNDSPRNLKKPSV